jgi:hypothetical protein
MVGGQGSLETWIKVGGFSSKSKDRSCLFANKPEFVITEITGKQILDSCN